MEKKCRKANVDKKLIIFIINLIKYDKHLELKKYIIINIIFITFTQLWIFDLS